MVVVRISREGLEKNEIPCSSNGHFYPQGSRLEVLDLFPMQSDRDEEQCKNCEVVDNFGAGMARAAASRNQVVPTR